MTSIQDPGCNWDIDFEIPRPDEQTQDTRYEPEITKEYPLFKQRWGSIRLIHPKRQPGPIRYWNGYPWKDAPELTRKSDTSDPPRGSRIGFGIGSVSCPLPSGSAPAIPLPKWTPDSDLYPTSPSNSAAQDEVEDGYALDCTFRFDPHFLTLRAQHSPSAEARIVLATEKLRELSDLHWEWTGGTTSDRSYAEEVVSPRIREVLDILWNCDNDDEGYINHTNGKVLKRNPDLRFGQGHGEDWKYDGKDCAPDLFTGVSSGSSSRGSGNPSRWRETRARGIGRKETGRRMDLDSNPDSNMDMDWGMVNVPVDVRIDPAEDMRSGNQDWDEKGSKNQVPRLVKYMVRPRRIRLDE